MTHICGKCGYMHEGECQKAYDISCIDEVEIELYVRSRKNPIKWAPIKKDGNWVSPYTMFKPEFLVALAELIRGSELYEPKG